ncbi:MAG: hypothetical protein K8I30_11440 [Anaerolineae bacterium]|nr:hypothetical protein [Anaerolineae bacterium]
MAKKVIVQNDVVSGTCKHAYAGQDASSAPCNGTGDYSYSGKMDAQLSDFVTIGGKPMALKTSQSHLPSGDPAHLATAATVKNPASCTPASFTTLLTVGLGKPNSAAGSTFVTVGGTAVLLDSDKMDTCGEETNNGASSVASSQQTFVNCSA